MILSVSRLCSGCMNPHLVIVNNKTSMCTQLWVLFRFFCCCFIRQWPYLPITHRSYCTLWAVFYVNLFSRPLGSCVVLLGLSHDSWSLPFVPSGAARGAKKKSFPSVGKLVPLDGEMVSPAQEHKMLPREALAEQAASVWVEERGHRPTGTEGLSRRRPFCVRIPLPASSPWLPSISGWGR